MKEFEEDIFDGDNEGSIDLIALIALLWKKKLTVLKITGIFMAIGLFLALFSPEKYTSQCIFVPQMSQGMSSKYSSLASMMGIDMALSAGGTDGQVNPRLYPLIMENPSFLKDLMQCKIHVEKAAEPITLLDYYTKKEYRKFNLVAFVAKYTVGLPRVLIGLVKKDKEPVIFDAPSPINAAGQVEIEPVIRFTKDEDMVANILYKAIKLDVDIKKGYLTLSVVMPEAQASTEFCQATYRLMQEYVRDFKKIKSEANLAFITSELEDARADYENAQYTYAKFMDSNYGIDKATAKIQKIRLETNYELSKQMFAELSKQELSAKIKVNEDTIAFTELAPPSVPLKRTSPKRAVMMVIWTILGGLFGCGFVVGKDKYASWKKSQEA